MIRGHTDARLCVLVSHSSRRTPWWTTRCYRTTTRKKTTTSHAPGEDEDVSRPSSTSTVASLPVFHFIFFLFKWLFLIKRLFCHEYAIHVLCISSNTEPTSQSARSRFSFSQKKKDIELPFIESGLLWEATFKKNTEKPGTITNF